MRSARAIFVDLASGAVVLGVVLVFFLPFLSTVTYGAAALGDAATRLWKPLGGLAMLLGAVVLGVGLPVIAFSVLRAVLKLLVTAFQHARPG